MLLTTLALASGLADAGRRSSGGGFGGSSNRSSSSGRSSSGSSWSSSSRPSSSGSYSTPRSSPSRSSTPRYTPPRNSSRASTYTTPRSSPPTYRTPSPSQGNAAGNRSSSAATSNRAPVPNVTQAQLNAWKNLRLPAGVPRRALTYSGVRSGQYAHQLLPGRYYPYPQTYYRSHGIGGDLLKYALILTAVASVADALDGPDVVVNSVQTTRVQPGTELSGITFDQPAVVEQRPGPGVWAYIVVGLLAAAAAWFVVGRMGRRR